MTEELELLAPDLGTVMQVAEAGSFSRAALRLGIEQSTVSRRVRAMEDRLGISIFERFTHGVRLTHAGKRFVDHVRRCQRDLSGALLEAREAGQARTGVLRLGFVWSFRSGPAAKLIAAFRKQHPEVRLQLVEAGHADLLARTLQHELDCAWVLQRGNFDPVFQVESLWKERQFLASSLGAPMGSTTQRADLEGKTILCRKGADLPRLQALLEALQLRRTKLEAHDCSLESLLSLTALGDGVMVVPESIAQAGAEHVAFTPIEHAAAISELAVVYRRETDNPALRRLLAIARSELRAGVAREPEPNHWLPHAGASPAT